MQSVFEETLPRPSVDTVRGEMLPSAWIFQPSQRNGQKIVTVIYLLQVSLFLVQVYELKLILDFLHHLSLCVG